MTYKQRICQKKKVKRTKGSVYSLILLGYVCVYFIHKFFYSTSVKFTQMVIFYLGLYSQFKPFIDVNLYAEEINNYYF